MASDGGSEPDESTTSDDAREDRVRVTITREMYDELRDTGSYLGADPSGQRVYLFEDFTTVGPNRGHDSAVDAWGPIFEIDDRASDLDSLETVADNDSKTVLLRGEHGDRIRVTEVHTGMWRIPEYFEVAKRKNTYHGPVLDLKVPDDYDGEYANDHAYQLTCPGKDSHPILWRAVTDAEGRPQSRSKISKVSVEIHNLSGYDICGQCEEPIQDPMHRRLAQVGQCPGGMNDGGQEDP